MSEINHNLNHECTHEDQDECCEREDVVFLIDEEGNTIAVQLIGDFSFEGSEYAVLADKICEEDDELNDDVTVLVYKIVDENGEDVLYEIEDDEEWNRVVEYWNNLED